MKSDESYDSFYSQFETPLMRQIRQEAYGEDIGQHSWVRVADLRQDILRLRLTGTSALVDLGCGPCGPLVYVVESTGCRALGAEVSAPALEAGRARAAAHGVSRLIELRQLDLNESLPLPDAAFTAAMSFDVILHLTDRAAAFREVARLLMAGGRFLFTDAAVLNGSISSEQVRKRSIHGITHFTAPGFNERCLELAGLRVLEVEDRTQSVLQNATGRREARLRHRAELEGLEGVDAFELQAQYLETIIALADGRHLARMMYLAER